LLLTILTLGIYTNKFITLQFLNSKFIIEMLLGKTTLVQNSDFGEKKRSVPASEPMKTS
jgi:hypothetical protein